jgi:hypothetical protein
MFMLGAQRSHQSILVLDEDRFGTFFIAKAYDVSAHANRLHGPRRTTAGLDDPQ